jgi:hypothetical protein
MRRRWWLVLMSVVLVVLLTGCHGKKARQKAVTTKHATSQARQLRQSSGFIVQGSVAAASPALSDSLGRIARRSESREPSLDDLLDGQYIARAYPRTVITFAQAQTSRAAFERLPFRLSATQADRARSAARLTATWRQLGPTLARALPTGFTAAGERSGTVSGRVTAIATASRCVPGNCRLWIGLAGGGVFRTNDGLAALPAWRSVSRGLTSTTIGTLAVDPADRSGNTLYAGTGESDSSVDSEAGTGLFKSTNGGNTWSLVSGSGSFARDRAITGIAIDPRNSKTIYVSTGRSIHGASAVQGGEAGAPSALPLGVYGSTDGGATFTRLFSEPVVPGDQTRTLSVTQLALDPNDPATVYVAVIARGLFRRSRAVDGDDAFHRVFTTMGDTLDSPGRLQFALADIGAKTRIYVGDSSPNAPYQRKNPGLAELFRVDDAGVPAARLLSPGGANVGWTRLSSTNPALPGFDSFRYCGQFCWYSNVVASPPRRPGTVLLASGFDYAGAGDGVTNGRALLRSTDAGVHFTDLSSDARSPAGAIHPDLHALAFSPTDPDVVFVGGDGGLVRTSGRYANVSGGCARRGLAPTQLADCRRLLARVPSRVTSLNGGLPTLLFQSISTSPATGEILAGAQDNGTWSFASGRGWRQVASGDGGQSAVAAHGVRVHTYFQTSIEVNFHGGAPGRWDSIDAPLTDSNEAVSFYMPLALDPRVPGTMFVGLQHVWRTNDYGGPMGGLDAWCAARRRLRFARTPCGDWKPLGADLTGSSFGGDRTGLFVAAIERAPGDSDTLWAATVAGRLFVCKNANAPPETAQFVRIDRSATAGAPGTPGRFVSGIVVDPKDPNHAWISYSGYNAYTPDDEAGHVFEVRFDPTSGKATWNNLSYNLGDQPITSIARDPTNGDLYTATDFGVLRLPAGATAWTEAAPGLPVVAVFGLTLSGDGRTLYAATHGRAAWALKLH